MFRDPLERQTHRETSNPSLASIDFHADPEMFKLSFDYEKEREREER